VLYVQLDTNWPDNEKIIDAGLDGAGAHAIILCLAKRLEKDGWVKRTLLLRRYGIAGELIDRLVALELLEADERQVRPWDWHDRNPSQAAIAARKQEKQAAGKRGNHERWHPGIPFESCPKCQVVAGSDRTESQELSTAIGCDPIPTSRGRAEGEVATAIAPSDPLNQLEVDAQERFRRMGLVS
jgi:hypothetical protein